ncbi:MAG: tyrosine-type recombinase/integrase [Heliomarina sp.]|uniref:tyrosine-type recombinase/integrase n=1 Tax=Heliomarina sp. TaxID=2917556 RepID=UPI004058F115
MPKRALTAAAVERLKPPKSGQEDHFDSGYPGLALRIGYGGSRSWSFHYRLYGKQHRFRLGTYPAMSLAEARAAWREARSKVEANEDPRAAKLAAKQAEPETVQAIGEQYIERYCRPRNRTADETARMFELHVYPEIGHKPLIAVTRQDILRVLDKAEERGAKVRANRILANLKRFLNWSVERGYLETSPAAAIKAPAKETARDRILSDDEVTAFLRACEKLGAPFGPIFHLLLLTGQRREEVTGATWSEFDLSEGTWSLAADRVKNARAHMLPLSRQAHEAIAALPRTDGTSLLFPARFSRSGSSTPRPVSGFGRAKERIDALMLAELKAMAKEQGDDPDEVELPPWRLHDLRRTAASGMARLGVGIHVVEKVLNHVTGSISGVAAVYNRHSYQDEMRSALQAWANYVDNLTSHGCDNVIPMEVAESV